MGAICGAGRMCFMGRRCVETTLCVIWLRDELWSWLRGRVLRGSGFSTSPALQTRGLHLAEMGRSSAAPVHGLAAIAERMNRYDQTPPRLFVQEFEKKGVIGRFCARM
jgi:hypothetical protein